MTQKPAKIVATPLDIEIKASVPCVWCGAKLLLGSTISGDMATIHSQPWCERFVSTFRDDPDGMRKIIEDMHAKMERGDA